MMKPLGSNRIARMLLLTGALVLTSAPLGACQRTLFADNDPSTPWKLRRYYGGDSAVETTESRKKSSEMGFGFPMGGGSGPGY